MKILWIVNIVFPYPAQKFNLSKTVFGGWLNGLADNLKYRDDVELAIATTYDGKELLKCSDDKITYYLIPWKSLKYNKKQEKFWKEVNEEFKPNLVHIHGTEFPHALAYMNINEKNIKTIVSIQGLVSKISEVYFANISEKEIKRNITFRDVLKKDTIFHAKKDFEKRGIYEKEIIKNADVILGRTTWDYANVKAVNPNAKYYTNNETLRDCFYDCNWDINNIERHSLFVSQAGYPIKGLHYLLEAVCILKKIYPDVMLYIGGKDIINTDNFISKLKLAGYGKYIKKLIKKYDIEDNVKFLGMLTETQMIERLLKTHVFILPSAIENSSNSLGEAMLIGMPCVASNTGGTMDMLEHKKEGFLYPYTEPAMCAEYVSRFFEDDGLSSECGKNAQQTAYNRHNAKKNLENIIYIYECLKKDK